MHALIGGIIPVVYGLTAVTPIIQIIVGGGLVYFSVLDFINVLEAVYDEGVGWTKCTISRAAFYVAGVIFGVKGIRGGIAKWRATGSLLKSTVPSRAIVPYDPEFAARQLGRQWIPPIRDIVPYNAEYAAQQQIRQLLNNGTISLSRMKAMIPKGAKKIDYYPSARIEAGFKYEFDINGIPIELKWHSPDLNAKIRWPDGNSANM